MNPAEPIEGSFAIAGVSEKLGIPVPTIRSWERRYGFPVPPRTNGKHRRYTDAEVEQLRAMRDAITQGHAAREAVDLIRDGPRTESAVRPEVGALLRAAVALDPNRARAILNEAAEALGPDQAAVQVALPALHEVGSRWKAGTCDVASEHLMTEAVRAWLARLTTFAPPAHGPLPIVLSCGPKELHTVGLEAFAMILAIRRWAVLTLGASTPVDPLVRAVRETKAPAAVIVAQRSVHRRSTVGSIEAVDRLRGVRAFFAGAAFGSPASRRGVPGTYLGTDLVAAASTIEATLLK